MDIVIRTPHGDAEVRIARTGGASVGALVETVTRRTAPPVLDVDGIAVPVGTSLHRCGLFRGSVVTVDGGEVRGIDGVEHSGGVTDDPVVSLVQVAGPGTGVRIELDAGTYRIGPGRRLHGRELSVASVETGALELGVRSDGSAVVTPATSAYLDGVELRISASVRWTGGLLEIGDRVFRLEQVTGADGQPSHTEPPPTHPRHAAHLQVTGGLAVFNRPPTHLLPDAGAARSDDVAELVRWALTRSPRLWHRRLTDEGALALPYGLTTGLGRPPQVERVDLAVERAVGVVGPSETARAITRGMLVAASAIHGPADIEIVVVSHPNRIAAWEWVKWLPHAQSSSGTPNLFTSDDDLATWADRRRESLPHVLVVADEPMRWRSGGSPLRQLLADPQVPIRLIALATDIQQLPAICRQVVSASVPFHPHLVDESTALHVARAMAMLDDPDLAPSARPPRQTAASPPEAAERASAGLLVSPFVIGRELTPLEHRLVVATSTDLTLDDLLAAHPGDGVPFALTDTGDEHDPIVRWWVPGAPLHVDGPGAAALLPTLAIGVADRCSADDVHLYVATSQPGRLAPLAALPHLGGFVDTSDPRQVDALVTVFDAELVRRASSSTDSPAPTSADTPAVAPAAMVLLTDDPDAFGDTLAELTVEGPARGIGVVVATHGRRGVTVDCADGTRLDVARVTGSIAAMVRSMDLEPATERHPVPVVAHEEPHDPR
jgi:hypothetical protein